MPKSYLSSIFAISGGGGGVALARPKICLRRSPPNFVSVLLQEFTDTFSTVVLYFGAVLLGIIVTGMPPYFAMDNAENHKVTVIRYGFKNVYNISHILVQHWAT